MLQEFWRPVHSQCFVASSAAAGLTVLRRQPFAALRNVAFAGVLSRLGVWIEKGDCPLFSTR